MNRNIIFKIVMALVLIGALVGIAVFAYNAGAAQRLAFNPPASSSNDGTLPLPHPYYGMHAFPFFGFGCFGVLIPLFLLFVVFGAFRALFWHGPRHWHRMHAGPWRDWSSTCADGQPGIPPFFAEWHRRAHESQPEPKSE